MPDFFRYLQPMCGIAGIITSDKNELSGEILKKMTDVLSHRGPDGEGFWISPDEGVGFGHTRLSIIDLSPSAAQPMHYKDRYVITYNGEIYNYIELRESLEKSGYRFQSKSDTEVILAAYDCWKEECLRKFDGMFAFAIYDKKQQMLFAARDRFGEKPFYYYNDNRYFAFASEMKALWAIGVPKEVDGAMLLHYLSVGHLQNASVKQQTFFEEIYSLPPAHFLLISLNSKKVITHSYWKLKTKQGFDISAEKAIERFQELFTTSVKRRLRSDVTVGSSLSGGLDSSSVVAEMSGIFESGQTENKPKCFSAVFPGFEKDESSYIDSVTKQFDIQNYFTQPTMDGMISDFEKICYHQEEPFSSSSIYAQFKVYELAASKQVKVLLDGQGADEILAGYYKYIHWYLQPMILGLKWDKFYREKKALKKNEIPYEWGFRNYLASVFPNHTTLSLEKRAYNKTNDNPYISKEFFYATRGHEWEGLHKPFIYNLNDILYFNTMQSGLEELLRFADRNSMAFGVEARLPFLSHELVQFIFSLPADYKIHQGWTKWLLRKAMDKKLPDKIVWRKEKIAYETPQQQWMQQPLLQDYIFEAKRKLVTKGFLNSSVLDKKIIPKNAHEKDNFDWRYLCAAQLF